MTLATLLLVILASFIHAGWNLLAKRAAEVGPPFVLAYNIVACIAYAPWVVYVLVHGARFWSWAGAGFIVLSGLLHLGYSLCLQRAYQQADLSVVYPVARGTGPLFSTLGAILLLGEAPSMLGVMGLILIIAGIALIATQGDLASFRRPQGLAGVRWGAATGGLIACYTVADAYAVRVLGIAPVLLDWFSNLVRLLLLAPMALAKPARFRATMRGHWGLAVGVGLLSPLSYIFVLIALDMGAPVSAVAPMREMSMMVGALMGMLILRERVRFWRLIGCAVVIAGVIALAPH